MSFRRRVAGALLIGFLAAACGAGAAIAPAPQATARAIVYHCPTRRAADGELQRALDAAAAGLRQVEFLDDTRPCAHAQAITAALTRKVGRDALRRARHHAFALMKVEGLFFSVEQYVFVDARTAAAATSALRGQQDTHLPGKATTIYQTLHAGPSLVLFVFDAHARHELEPAFDAIARALRSQMPGA